MTIEAALKAKLATTLGCSVYPLSLPPSATLPACTYTRITTAREYTHDGDANLERIRFQVDLWASSYLAVRALAATFRTAWSGFSGTVGTGVTCSGAFVVGEHDLYDPEPKAYRVSIDLSMWIHT